MGVNIYNGNAVFKFQYGATNILIKDNDNLRSVNNLNSNMELLICCRKCILCKRNWYLNSNMELLISWLQELYISSVTVFKFQYGATNIKISSL